MGVQGCGYRGGASGVALQGWGCRGGAAGVGLQGWGCRAGGCNGGDAKVLSTVEITPTISRVGHTPWTRTEFISCSDPEGADTPPLTGQSDRSPRATTAPSSRWLLCVFNGCRHTSQDRQLHGLPRHPDCSRSHSAARHTRTARSIQTHPVGSGVPPA